LLLFVGKFHGYKDATIVVDALNRLKSEGRDVELVMLSGGGNQYDGVRQRIMEVGRSDDITIITEITDERLYRFYAAASVFTLPSRNEAFGLVFLEAMASGTPIVSVDAGAAPEVVGDAGKLVPQKDIDAFTQAVRRILDDPEVAASLRKQAYKRVEQFSWERAAKRYFEAYSEVVSNAA
jgi:glycosyltransferase involved in cell wall biosynthesis